MDNDCMVKSIFMSGEQVTNFKFKNSLNKDEYLNKRKKVNINILLNKVRADKKREQLESNIFFGIVAVAIISVGFFISL